MEVAHLNPFFNSELLFSLMYDDYEKNLKHELWLCHKHMNFTLDELERMPIQDRKYYVALHNKSVQEEKQQLSNKKSSKR